MRTLLLLLTMSLGLSACAARGQREERAAAPPPIRFATYNTSLYSEQAGGAIARLEADDPRARQLAAVIQHVRPDVLLLNEFDFDPAGRAADLFQQRYLEQSQAGQPSIHYPHRYLAPVNTGVPSGLDLNRDGRSDGPDDAWGFGHHPGQYGMLVLSRFPIDATRVRTFQRLRWATLPGARRPVMPDGAAFWPDAVWQQLRLSSKSHWDVPVETPLGTIHFLVSHPTPPVFDGEENRNGLRNFDEIRLWAEYLTPGDKPWLCDDAGQCGGLPPDARFVLAGDLNADPVDGAGVPGSIAQLLQHPRVDAGAAPESDGAAARAVEYGLARRGAPRTHTGDFGPQAGTLRLDYVLPSVGFAHAGGGVFWPISPPEHVEWAKASDHHLVWLDLADAVPAAGDPR
jgi:endonuclease/exonuclease/phosphatase family metal-dependent hydrolase